MNNGVTTENLMRQLPRVLQDDKTMRAFAQVFSEELVIVKNEAKQAIIYNRIDMLPEAVLDALAYDFKVDWYDYEASIDVKRKLIKNSVNVHRTLGTRFAVESALSDLYSEASVLEWFEYGGGPYHFQLRVMHPWESEKQVEKVIRAVDRTKSKRSRLDGITFVTESTYSHKVRIGLGLLLGGEITIGPVQFEAKDMTIPHYIGIGQLFGGSITIWPKRYQVPGLALAEQGGFGMGIGGATTIKRGETV